MPLTAIEGVVENGTIRLRENVLLPEKARVVVIVDAFAESGTLPRPEAASDVNGQALTAARARMRELFDTITGFRMGPKIPREELYDRERVP